MTTNCTSKLTAVNFQNTVLTAKLMLRGEIGREFTLQFKNNTADRVLARFSVDGLSVLDGKSADKDSSGYICDAYSSIEIAGWRTSLEEVRKFEFSSKGKSYAGKTTDNTTNCGVIGVQVYSEKQPKVKIVEKHIHHHHDHYPDPYPWPTWPKWPTSIRPLACGNQLHIGVIQFVKIPVQHIVFMQFTIVHVQQRKAETVVMLEKCLLVVVVLVIVHHLMK